MLKNSGKLFLISLALLACQPVSETSDTDIIRGQLVKADSPAYFNTVAIGANESPNCTASIIADNVLLTAAHCVDRPDSTKMSAYFKRPDDSIQGAKAIAFRAVHLFKPYGAAQFPNFDIALVELQEKVPQPFKPIEILRDPKVLQKGKEVLLAGYGQRNDPCPAGQNCGGLLREGLVEFQEYLDKALSQSLLIFHGDPAKLQSGACYGDSGGPAFVQQGGRWYLIGVTNGVTANRLPESDQSCESGWDIYTFAGDYVNWMERILGRSLMQDAASNADRLGLPIVELGPKQAYPNTWEEWVSYGNHEDPVWYLMRSMMESLSYDVTRLGLPKDQSDDFLHNPAVSASVLQNITQVFVKAELVTDITPLSFLPKLSYLSLAAKEIRDLKGAPSINGINSLSLESVQSLSSEARGNFSALLSKIRNITISRPGAKLIENFPWGGLLDNNSLTIRQGELNLNDLQGLTSNFDSFSLEFMQLSGRLSVEVPVRSLSIQSIKHKEGLPANDYLNFSGAIDKLLIQAMDHSALELVNKIKGLRSLALVNMKLKAEDLPFFPAQLKNLSLSGNFLEEASALLLPESLVNLDLRNNPLLKADCPAKNCAIDFYLRPSSLQEYCGNLINNSISQDIFPYRYPYSYLLNLEFNDRPSFSDSKLQCQYLTEHYEKVKGIFAGAFGQADFQSLSFLKDLEWISMGPELEVRNLQAITQLDQLKTVSAGSNSLDLSSFTGLLGPDFYDLPYQEGQGEDSCPIVNGYCLFNQLAAPYQSFVFFGPPLGFSAPVGPLYSSGTKMIPGLSKPVNLR